MLQIQLLVLLTLCVEIYPTDTTVALVETYVVESLEAGAGDRFHAVVRHEEIFLPAHEDVLTLLIVLEREGRGFGGFGETSPGREACPVLEVNFFGGAP